MKTIVLGLIGLLSSVAHAAPANTFTVAITGARVEAVIPPPMLTVQPQAYLVFKHTSCAKLPVQLDVKQVGRAYNVEVVLPLTTVDCMALGREHEYRLQITSDYDMEPVHVVNHLEGSQAASFYELPTTILAGTQAIGVKAARLEVGTPPPMAAVQPTAHVNVKVSSCSARDLEAQVIEKDGILNVLIVDKKLVDCRAAAVERDYSVQISSDYQNQPVRVLNPVELDMK